MRDDYYSAAWADNRKHLSLAIGTAIHKVIHAIGKGLARQNAYDFDAPWRQRSRAGKPDDCQTAA